MDTCILCGSEASEKIMTGTDRMLGLPGEYDCIRCKTCGLARTEPQIPEEDRAKYYAPEESAAAGKQDRVRMYQSRLAKRIDTAIPEHEGRRVFEIGCGEGVLLDLLRAYRWEPHGVELGEESSSIARSKGLNVETGDLFSVKAEDGSFDAVVMSHVLEHLPDPMAALKRVYRLLKPGGLFLLTLPNYACIERQLFGKNWFPWCLPPHLYHFDSSSTRRALVKAGFVPKRATYLPFFFVTQSLRYALRKSASAAPGPAQPTASSGKGGLRTAIFRANLLVSSFLGRFVTGEIMEIEAWKPRRDDELVTAPVPPPSRSRVGVDDKQPPTDNRQPNPR